MGDPPIVRTRTPSQLRYQTHGGLTPAAPDHDARYARRIRFPLPVRCHCHGGLTPAAPDHDARYARRIRFPLPVRCHYHGKATPAALCGRAFVHRKNRFFAGKRSHCNTRAGGVSPPWQLLTRMQRQSAHTPSVVRRTSALVSAQTCFHTHGKATLAAPGCDRGAGEGKWWQSLRRVPGVRTG
jgi:hypothetical protein